MSKTIWVGAVAYNPKVVTIWEGMRGYFHEEAHLPVEVVLFQSYETQVLALLAQPGVGAGQCPGAVGCAPAAPDAARERAAVGQPSLHLAVRQEPS